MHVITEEWLKSLPPIIGPNGTPWHVSVFHAQPGWEPLIKELIEDLFKLGWDGNLAQIKEKFGGLRFYIGYGSDPIFDRIDEAEGLSLKTCESCGKEASPKSIYGWISTICDGCLSNQAEPK